MRRWSHTADSLFTVHCFVFLQFREQAHEIIERTNAKLEAAVNSLNSLSKTITASAIAQGGTFPFYSLPFYGKGVISVSVPTLVLFGKCSLFPSPPYSCANR